MNIAWPYGAQSSSL